jgi:hypothetical protein
MKLLTVIYLRIQKQKKDKMLGKIVGIKERTLTFDLENQYGSRFS